MKNKKGFTLIELLASITLIAILAIIVIPSSLNLINKSNKEQCQKVVDNILSEAELCYLDKMDVCYPSGSYTSKTVLLNSLYINGYIDEEYESKSTNIKIDNINYFNNYSVTIDVSAGYPKYTFNDLSEFCGE